ncbi:MAG: MFS transporter [Holophaga sp.]
MKLLKRLERLPYGRPHTSLLFMGGLGYTFDGMDAGLIAFILPPVIKLWGLTNAQAGVVGSSLMVGYLVGAFSAGTLGDLIGRRKVMMWALAIYTIATLFAALATSWGFLFWSRVVAGFGVGAESAIVAPYLSEFVPRRIRGRFIGSLAGFFSFGFVFAALLGYFIVPTWAQGWRIAQVVTFLPIIMLLWWRRSLPESPRWLMQRRRTAEAEEVVVRMETSLRNQGKSLPDFEGVDIPAMGVRRTGNFFQNLAALWSPGLSRTTGMLWALWITYTFSYYGFFIWVPTLLVKQGMTITKSFGYSIIIYLAQIPGYYGAAYICEKLDRKWTIVGSMVLCAISAYLMSGARTAFAVTLFGFCVSLFINGVSAAMYAFTPELYPTSIRTTGMGVASSFGRIGGLAAPLIIGFTYAQIGFAGVFLTTTVVMLVGAFAVAVLGEKTAGKSLEQITLAEVSKAK